MRLHKTEIARRQLCAAIELYRSGGDYLSVITLAGAAEEILGNLLRRQSIQPVLEQALAEEISENDGTFGKLRDKINQSRNALKHARDAVEDEITIAPADAITMLGRAITNYALLCPTEAHAMICTFVDLMNDHPDLGR